MKVLILHQHFNTPQKGGPLRSYYLAQALIRHGIVPVVITAHSHPVYNTEMVDGIEVHYLPVAYNNRFGFYKRSMSFLRYVNGAIRTAAKLKDVKICYAISVPLTVGLAALWMQKRLKIPFIFEVGDLWPDAPVQLGYIQNYFFKKVLYQLEKIIYLQSQTIVALSPMIKSAIEKKAPGKKIVMIPNMADIDFYKPEKKDPVLEKKFNVENKFVVSYIGALGFANGLDYYLECARAAQKAALPVHFLLCGDGAMDQYLKRIANSLQLRNLSFIPFQNREGVRQLLNITDAAYIGYRPVPILETGSPNKYFDALAAGKLILINFGGWIKDEIQKHQCGLYLDPKHPYRFVEQITPFLNNNDVLQTFGQRARQLALTKYNREKLGDAFASIFIHQKPQG